MVRTPGTASISTTSASPATSSSSLARRIPLELPILTSFAQTTSLIWGTAGIQKFSFSSFNTAGLNLSANNSANITNLFTFDTSQFTYTGGTASLHVGFYNFSTKGSETLTSNLAFGASTFSAGTNITSWLPLRSMGSRTRNWPACLCQARRWQSWSRRFLRTQNASRS